VSKLLSALGINAGWQGPATILLIGIVALIAWYALRIGAGQVARRLLARQPQEADTVLPQVELERRVRTLERTAVRTGGVVIVIVAVLMALSSGFDVDIGPAVAGLGIVGIAVGFGAQTLIRDWLAGIFVVLENQYNQGDVVRIAGVSGVVEDFSLRRTMLRDLDGQLARVANQQTAQGAFLDSLADAIRRPAFDLGDKSDIACNGEMRKQTNILDDVANHTAEADDVPFPG